MKDVKYWWMKTYLKIMLWKNKIKKSTFTNWSEHIFFKWKENQSKILELLHFQVLSSKFFSHNVMHGLVEKTK
jgi:hypothetical protein